MNKTLVQLLLSAGATAALLILLSLPIGQVPPLGPFLNPSSGFWANAETQYPTNYSLTLDHNALSEPVNVYFDEHNIPHIFAENDRDLYFAQGYITARDRLWQMEMQTHAAAGRLSEILGPQMLDYDRYQRRIGMVYGAEQSLEGIMENDTTAQVVKAYSTGVNEWIRQLDPAEMPLEYKILNYEPEKWTPLKTALLLKYMTYTLASNHEDVRMSNTRTHFGDDFIQNVLDIHPEWNDPVIPPSREWNFKPEQVNKPGDDFTPSLVEDILPFQADPANGSNNWAVDGSKTKSGYPILANDPHLGLSLPSIWYAVQLHSPNQNTMGASLPGAPSIIVGFNEHAAWGTTNVGADVWDWYEIEFRDSTLAEYRYDGQWRSTKQRVEEIRVKGEETVQDTVTYTHHGPVVQSSGDKPMRSGIPKYHAMRWIGHEKSNEINFFLNINRAQNHEDYRKALRYYHSPAQNWVFADSSDIAITAAGKYPLKWNQQGRYISNGSNPAYDWQGWIPFEHIPSVRNPERGFVSSANQDITDDSYPYYLDDDFAPFERGKRINDRLSEMEEITPSDMQQLQLDTHSYHAEKALPLMLDHLQTDSLSENRKKYAELLSDWDFKNEGNATAPSIFYYWWEALYKAIWDDEYGSADIPLQRPSRDQTVHLMRNKPNASWFDNINTSDAESLSDLINNSFATALKNLENDHGYDAQNWQWGNVNTTNIPHLGEIPGLGRNNLFTDGGAESINATRGSHGPSWRMIVQLGPRVKAWGIYPGGQSGNPGSNLYENMIDDWNAGELYRLNFMKEEPDKDKFNSLSE